MPLLFLFGVFGIDFFNSKLELPIKQLFTLAPLPSPPTCSSTRGNLRFLPADGGAGRPVHVLPLEHGFQCRLAGAGGPGQLPAKGPSWFFGDHASPSCCILPFLPSPAVSICDLLIPTSDVLCPAVLSAVALPESRPGGVHNPRHATPSHEAPESPSPSPFLLDISLRFF